MLPDSYTVHARIYPAALAVLPILVALGGTGRLTLGIEGLGLAALGSAAAVYALSHLTRQAGRRLEPSLFRDWGGKPTTVRIRLRSDTDSPSIRARYREHLAAIVGCGALPTEEEERNDPAGSDERYEAAVMVLRGRMRDKSAFPVVFSENTSYGFRRNALGIRALGVTMALLGAAGCAASLWLEGPTTGRWSAIGAELLLLVFWGRVVSKDWVRYAADCYADALFTALLAVPLSPET